MSFRDNPEFKKAHAEMKARSGKSLADFDRRMLDIEAERAATAPVSEVMSPAEFIERILPEGFDAGQGDGKTDEAIKEDRAD